MLCICYTIWAIDSFTIVHFGLFALVAWRKYFDMVLDGFELELAARDGFKLHGLAVELELINSNGANGQDPTSGLVVRNGDLQPIRAHYFSVPFGPNDWLFGSVTLQNGRTSRPRDTDPHIEIIRTMILDGGLWI